MQVNYGEKIRSLRKSRGLTLTELGDAAGVSASYISQVERGLCSISLSSLEQISKSLGVNIKYFFFDEIEHAGAINNSLNGYVVPPESLYYFRTLSNKSGNKELIVDEVSILPCKINKAFDLKGTGLIYILSGILTIEWENESSKMFHGDSLYFDGSTDYACFNRSNRLVNMLLASYGDGGRLAV